MDMRFRRAWDEIDARRRTGERLPVVLRNTATSHLIAALAAAGQGDPVVANAIATELLNRQTRAPFLGAFLVGVGLFVATFVVDAVLTGSPFFELSVSSTRGYVISGLAAAVALFSLLMYVSWRGKSRWIHRLVMGIRLRRGGRAW